MMLTCGKESEADEQGAECRVKPICGFLDECPTSHWSSDMVKDAAVYKSWDTIEDGDLVSWDGFEGNDNDLEYPDLFKDEHDVDAHTCKNPEILEYLRANRERANRL
jgi:hypothetical protein